MDEDRNNNMISLESKEHSYKASKERPASIKVNNDSNFKDSINSSSSEKGESLTSPYSQTQKKFGNRFSNASFTSGYSSMPSNFYDEPLGNDKFFGSKITKNGAQETIPVSPSSATPTYRHVSEIPIVISSTKLPLFKRLLPDGPLLFQQFIFLATGLFTTLVSQLLFYEKEVKTESMLTVLSTYLGMASILFLPKSVGNKYVPVEISTENEEVVPKSTFNSCVLFLWSFIPNSKHIPFKAKKGLALVSLMDVVGSAILAVGLFWVGSGLFQVIYASVIIFTAIGSKLFLRKTLKWGQWLSIILIVAGLSISGSDRASTPEKESTRNIGFITTLIGTCIYSGVYILNEHLLASKSISQRQQCKYVGIFSSFYTLIIMVFISIPSIISLPWDRFSIYIRYLGLILSGLFHNVSYFYIMNRSGGVATGVLQALRAVLVFFLSHFAFCGLDDQQCFTSKKGTSTFVVVIGVLWFSISKSSSNIPTAAHNEPIDELPLHSNAGSTNSLDIPDNFGDTIELEYLDSEVKSNRK